MRRLLLGSCAVVLGFITLAANTSHAEGLRATRGKQIFHFTGDAVGTEDTAGAKAVFDGRYFGNIQPNGLSQRGIRCQQHSTIGLDISVRQLRKNKVEGFVEFESGPARGTGSIKRGGITLTFKHKFQGYRRTTTINLANVTTGSAYATNSQKLLANNGSSCTWRWEGAVFRN